MSENFQIAPWYNAVEWNSVYYNIFDVTATLTNKQNALEQLMVWKARCPSLPSAIESTVSLLFVHIQDQGQCYEISNDHLMRLAYSSALMRFINHMLDKDTAKGLSLYQAARSLGVPEWIIELRHDTAHSNKLPNIGLLREASIVSLKWLQKNYWDSHKTCIDDYVVGKVCNETEIEKRITAMMNFCVSLSICSHPKCNIKYLVEITDVNLREYLICDAKELLEDSLDFSDLKSISMGILRDAINSRAKKLLSNEFSSSYVNKVLLSDESAFMSLELLKHLNPYTSKCLNKDYEQCFVGLLRFLYKHDLLKDFLLDLIKVTQCETENGIKKCKLAAKWVSAILKNLYKNQRFLEKLQEADNDMMPRTKKELETLYYHWYPNEKNNIKVFSFSKPIPEEFTNINFIQPIISTYNSYLTFFIKDLLKLVRPCLPDPVITKICQLAKVIASPEKFPVVSTKIYTANDLEDTNDMEVQVSKHYEEIENIEVDVEEKQISPENGNQQKFGVWKVASASHAWSTCPIGQLPWLNIEPIKM